MAMFTGSGVALITPFNGDGTVNYEALKILIEFQIQNGTDAIIACGTTGEASTLSDDEQLEVIRFTVSQVNKRIPVIAGAGSNYTEHGIALCKGSQKAGADGVLLVSPYYNKATQKGLVQHFKALAASVDLPVMLYNIQGRTGINIFPETLQELSQIDNIVAIKEASDNIIQIAQIAHLCGDKLDIYAGNDNQIVPIMALGGKGVVSVAANIWPRPVHDIAAKFLEGDIAGSRELQLKLMPLFNALFIEINPIPVKEALNLMGMNAGGHRMPLTKMEEANAGILKNVMKDFGLI